MVPSLTEMRRAVSRRLRAISRPAARTALSTSGGAVFGGFRAALPRCRHGLAGSRLPVGKCSLDAGMDSQGAVYLLVNGIDAQSSTVVYYLIKLTQRGIGSFTRTCSRFRPRSWR